MAHIRPSAPFRSRRRPAAALNQSGQGGQILVVFVLAMVAILAIGALVIDGANTLVVRRRLQNVGDAAALAGANVLQASGSAHVCSTASSTPPGTPRADIVAAIWASLDSNYPDLGTTSVTITCPDGWENQAVRVDIGLQTASYLGGAIGLSAPTVHTTSTGLNGQISGSTYSVVLLDPSNSDWPSKQQGCPSFLINGGPTLRFDGSVFINSACAAADGGALASNGNSASVNFATGRALYRVGGYNPGPLTINPATIQVAKRLDDPLATLEDVAYSGMTVRSSSRLVLSNTTRVLDPGVYTGGIQLKNSSVALLRPGIYVFDGGGLEIGAQAAFCSITATSTATTCANFETDCPDVTCGVLLYNRGTTAGASAMGQITVGAGATLKLRAYDDRAIAGEHFEYRNLLVWQDKDPAASPTYVQPVIQLSGGGAVDISGTLYAPHGKILMGGNAGGSGGSTINLTLQFIAWDLEMSGNSAFRFIYSDDDFARPKDYGLVQ